MKNKTLVQESMTSGQISAQQQQHYMLDDTLRTLTQQMTAEQKRTLIDEAQAIIDKGGEE